MLVQNGCWYISENKTSSRSHEYGKARARLEVRANFFSVRTCDDWNMIPEEVKSLVHRGLQKVVEATLREPATAVVETRRGRRTRCLQLACLQNGPSGPDGGIYTSIPKKVRVQKFISKILSRL
jgi:hypothetical protein